MELVKLDGKMFLKRSPVYTGISNQQDAKVICDYHDPEGFPTTEFILIFGAEVLLMYYCMHQWIFWN